MNYSDLTALCRTKARGYTADQCEFAIRDIHTTIALHEGDLNHPYIQKLWAELDAMRDRLAFLQRKTIGA